MGQYESKIAGNAYGVMLLAWCPCKGSCTSGCEGSCKHNCAAGCKGTCLKHGESFL